jgi:hypothetical protein
METTISIGKNGLLLLKDKSMKKNQQRLNVHQALQEIQMKL